MGQGWTSLFTGISLQTFAVPYALSQLMCPILASSITHLTHHQLICYEHGTLPTLHRGIAPLVLRGLQYSFKWFAYYSLIIENKKPPVKGVLCQFRNRIELKFFLGVLAVLLPYDVRQSILTVSVYAHSPGVLRRFHLLEVAF